jgi:hypothetical protein
MNVLVPVKKIAANKINNWKKRVCMRILVTLRKATRKKHTARKLAMFTADSIVPHNLKELPEHVSRITRPPVFRFKHQPISKYGKEIF